MDRLQKLNEFMSRGANDPCIGPSHISLYGAILYMAGKQDCFTIVVFSRELMPLARIASVATYHKCINDLKNGGYIKYYPSNDPGVGSEIELV